VHCKILFSDETSDRKRIESFHEKFVNLGIVALKHFFSEREGFRHVARFMVATKKSDVFRELKFDGKQKKYNFYAQNASINVVT